MLLNFAKYAGLLTITLLSSCDRSSIANYDYTQESLVLTISLIKNEADYNGFAIKYTLQNVGENKVVVCKPDNRIYLCFAPHVESKIDWFGGVPSPTPIKIINIPAQGKIEGVLEFTGENSYQNRNGRGFLLGSGKYEIYLLYMYNMNGHAINSNMITMHVL